MVSSIAVIVLSYENVLCAGKGVGYIREEKTLKTKAWLQQIGDP